MLILKTITHETIWGGKKLAPYADIKSDKIGHLYSLVSNGEFESEILNGEWKGKLFKEYFEENKERFGLSEYKQFPFVLAIVDATDDLSIQVHPNDELAKELEGNAFGKNESWYFIEAPNSGKIYNGCKAKTKEELIQKVSENKYSDVIDYLPIESGDYVYVEAGTMHAMSAGSLVYEIEENCNATYRVYDFNRRDKNGNLRQLHTGNALRAIDVNKKSVAEKYSGEKRARLYSTELYKNITKYTNNSSTLECLTILDGEGILDNCKIQRGVTIVLEPQDSVQFNSIDCIISKYDTGEFNNVYSNGKYV